MTDSVTPGNRPLPVPTEKSTAHWEPQRQWNPSPRRPSPSITFWESISGKKKQKTKKEEEEEEEKKKKTSSLSESKEKSAQRQRHPSPHQQSSFIRFWGSIRGKLEEKTKKKNKISSLSELKEKSAAQSAPQRQRHPSPHRQSPFIRFWGSISGKKEQKTKKEEKTSSLSESKEKRAAQSAPQRQRHPSPRRQSPFIRFWGSISGKEEEKTKKKKKPSRTS